MHDILYSLIVPVYKNEANVLSLLGRVEELYRCLDKRLEAIFIVDASPDQSYKLLRDKLAAQEFPAELINLARNCGSALAVRMGLSIAGGKYFAVMSADLQEPAELIISLFTTLRNDAADIAIGVRTGRDDPLCSKMSAILFWKIYNKLVQSDMPPGGVDTFCINQKVKNALMCLNESNSSLVGQIIWLGFRRKEIPYKRRAREIGESSWSVHRKLKYMLDSVFSFTDLPIAIITSLGILGLCFSVIVGSGAFLMWYVGDIPVKGYTTLLLVLLFSLSLVLISLGVIGNYVWRAFENTKNRPLFVVMEREKFNTINDDR